MSNDISEKKAFSEAKRVFKESEGRKPNLNNDKDLLVVSALQLGIQHGYRLGYDKFYTPLCEKCNYNKATCFGPGAYCDECSLEMDDDEFDDK